MPNLDPPGPDPAARIRGPNLALQGRLRRPGAAQALLETKLWAASRFGVSISASRVFGLVVHTSNAETHVFGFESFPGHESPVFSVGLTSTREALEQLMLKLLSRPYLRMTNTRISNDVACRRTVEELTLLDRQPSEQHLHST